MISKICCVYLLLFSCFQIIFLQAEETYEELLDLDFETNQITEQIEILDDLQKNKLDLNKVGFDELLQLPWISPKSAQKILNYRKHHKLNNKKSLLNAGISKDVIKDISPYICYKYFHPAEFLALLRNEYSSSTEYENPLKLYQKYQLNWKNYQFNLLAKKDAGETSIIDYLGSSVYAKNMGIFRRIVLGNYRLSIGQGIFFASKLGISMGSNSTGQPIKHSTYLKPYTSSSESFSLFGAATRMDFHNFSLIPFYSDYPLDATLENNKIKSIYVSGYHRTDSEVKKKDQIREKLYGFNLGYGSESKIGLTAFHSEFNKEFVDTNQFRQTDKIGANYNIYLKNFNFFGEYGFYKNRNAFISGVFWEKDLFKSLIIFRNYDTNFLSFHGNPFHARGEFDNERGIYYGFSFRPFIKSRVDVYFDIYTLPFYENNKLLPVYGNQLFFQFTKKWKNSYLRFYFKQKTTEERKNINDISKFYNIQRNTIRTDYSREIHPKVELKCRAEYTFHNFLNADKFDTGVLFYQEIRFTLNRNMKNYLRICEYHTGDILLYMYENDLDGVMLNSIFKGDGIFYYYLFKYNLSKHYSLQFKFSQKFWKSDNGYSQNLKCNLNREYKIKLGVKIDF
ncbi:MAG: helix-hairpin-helix domain-containing protein [Candidatus Cloacimonadota bacterium]|nr:helix-hairpin-helix domain-containing protein [Candidatus Cloacimonadota bacterium]